MKLKQALKNRIQETDALAIGEELEQIEEIGGNLRREDFLQCRLFGIGLKHRRSHRLP